MGHPSWALTVSSSCPINLDRGTCAPQHVINNLEHTFMDSAISAAFNPIALYGTYMRLLYCCNYFALYASFLPPSFYFFFTFYSLSQQSLESRQEKLPRADQGGRGPTRVAQSDSGAVTCSPHPVTVPPHPRAGGVIIVCYLQSLLERSQLDGFFVREKALRV